MDSDELREIGFTEGEFVFPTDLAIPELTATDVIEVLAGPSRRGRRLFGALFSVSLAGLGLALVLGSDRQLTIAGVIASAVFGGLFFHLKKNLRLAEKIGFDP